MKTLIIIQARMTSTRLPGKVLLPLCHKTVLEVMIERLSDFHDDIIIATTDDGSEKPIVELCEKIGVAYFKGHSENVLLRYVEAAKHFGATANDTIIRLTSDCPVIDQNIVTACMAHFIKTKAEYCANDLIRTFPRGMDCELFTFKTLQKVLYAATSDYDKEHVTTYIYDPKNRDTFSISLYKNRVDHSHYRLTIDAQEDYALIQHIYNHFHCKTDFSYEALIEFLQNNKTIASMNRHLEQSQGSQCAIA